MTEQLHGSHATQMKLPMLALLCSLGLLPQSVGQSTQSFDSVRAAILAVQQTHGVLTGVEIPTADGANKAAIILDLSDVNATRLLDTLVKERPIYVWHRDDIVYNVYPMQKSNSLAQVKIANFVVADASFQEVQQAVSNLPELKHWSVRHHVEIIVEAPSSDFLSILSASGVPPKPKTISLNLHNVQLCTILNQAIREFGKWQWVISAYPQLGRGSQ